MLGLLALSLTSIMIFSLIKNALTGKQLSKEDVYHGSIELIIPITPRSEFYLEAWLESIQSFNLLPGQLKVHLLIDGHHPSANAWHEIKHKIPFLEIHSFTMRPAHLESVPWMLEQIAAKINSQIVIIGDAELVPADKAFLSSAKICSEKQKSIFVVPQTGRYRIFGEMIWVLNPTLAYVSFAGLRALRNHFARPLFGLSQGWMVMEEKTFKEIEFKAMRILNWKEAILRQWDEHGKSFQLAFGEKFLLRYYPEGIKTIIYQLKDIWADLWKQSSKKGFWLFVMSLLIWGFPIIFFLTHPFWSIVSFILLVAYRFFTKIVFQESWTSLVLHPVGCLVWLATLVWWMFSHLRSRYGARLPMSS
jgi:hypothetical protein